MPDKLDRLAKVVADLMDRGYTSVEVELPSGPKIRVTREEYVRTLGPSQNVRVSVNARASAYARAEASAQLDEVLEHFKKSYAGEDLVELQAQVAALREELPKSKPREAILREIAKWALDKGWDVAIKLLPIILDRMTGG